jgi:O-antigen ligase
MLLILLAALPLFFLVPAREPFELPKLVLLEAGVLALGVWGAAAVLARRARRPDWSPPAAALLLFLVSAAVSSARSPNPWLSMFGAALSRAGLLAGIGTVAVFFVARSVVRHPASWKRLAGAVSLAAGAAAGYALLQALGLDPLPWSRIATFAGSERVFGTLGHPNLLGAYLAMALPLVVWLGQRVRGRAWGATLGAVAALGVGATVATLSRAAWAGLAAGAGVGAALAVRSGSGASEPGPRTARTFWVAALVGVLVVSGVYLVSGQFRAPLSTRMAQVTDLSAPSTQSRVELWRAGLRMFREHPITGAGLDAFGLQFPRYRTAAYWTREWLADPTKAHSEPIQILATQGLLGGLAAAVVLLLVSVSVWRATGRGSSEVRSAAAAAGGSLSAFALTDLTGFTVLATGTLAAALAGAISSGGREGHRVPGRSPAPGVLLTLAVPALIIFLLVAIPPWRADRAHARASAYPLGSSERAERLLEAERSSRWDGRYPYELCRTYLEAAGTATRASDRTARLRTAEAACRRAIALSPFDGAAHLERARVLAALHRADAGSPSTGPVSEELRRAAELDPENPILLLGSAKTWLEIDRPDEARSMALQAVRLYPSYGSPLAFVGYLALRAGRFQDGVDTLQAAVARGFRGDRNGEATAWYNLSLGYLMLDRAADAYEAASRALVAEPSLDAARRIREEAGRRLTSTPSTRGSSEARER